MEAPAPGRGLVIAGPIAAEKLDFQKLLECAICCDYLQIVTETPCCHSLFCKSCLAGWARSNTSCPGCRAKLQVATCLGNVPIQRFVDSLPMECPFKPDGCGGRPPRSELEKHKELCNYRPEKLAEAKKAKQLELQELRRRVEGQEKKFRDAQAKMKAEDRQASLSALANDVFQLAVSLRAVGSFQEGAEVAERARALRAELLGGESVSVAECITLVGLLQKDQAQYERALASFEAASKLYASSEIKIAAQAECWLAEGDIFAKLAKYAEADERYQKALTQVKGIDNSPGLGAVLNSIGLIAKKRSEYDKALTAYSEAIKVVKVDDPLWSEVVSNLADVFRKLGRYDEARDLYLKSLQKLESMYGGNHPLIGEVANNLGMLCKKEGKYAEALEYYRTALKLARHFKGKDHPSVGVFLTNLGDIYRKKGDFKLAEGTYMEALSVLEKALGPHHIELADVLNSQGLVLKKRADYDGAEALYRRAIAIVVKTFGEAQNYKQGIYENNLADCFRKRTKFDEALTLYKHALSIIQLKLGVAHSEAAEVQHNMGQVHHQLGKYPEAIKLYDEALVIIKKEFGDKHYKVGMFLNSLGLSRAMMGNYVMAYDELKLSSQILIHCLGLDHIEVADTYSNLGDVCMKLVTEGKVPAAQKDLKLQEAKKYFTEANRIVVLAFGPDHTKAKQLASLLFIVDNFASLT